MILKIVIIAIICIFLSSLLKNYNAELSMIVNVCGGVLIFLICADSLKNIIDYLISFYDLTGLNFDFMTILLKVIGVGYITEFTADIAEDFGNKTIASKVLLGGKVVICGMTLPIIKKLLSILSLLVSWFWFCLMLKLLQK